MKRSSARPKLKAGRQAILILGMHRSGTSALSGVVCALGAAAPRNLLPANFANPTGYWESSPLVEVNDELLVSAGSSWDDWRQIDPAWYLSDQADRFRKLMGNVLLSEYDDKNPFVVKDPRLCRVMPLFLSVLKDLSVAPVALLTVRDPLEVAFSLRRRDNVPIEKSIALWLRHMLDAELYSRNMPRCFISYENLLKDWRLEMNRATEATGVVWPASPKKAAISVEQFLTADLHRERIQTAEPHYQDLSFLVNETYDLLRAQSQLGNHSDILPKLDIIRKKFDDASDFFGAVTLATIKDRDQRLLAATEELKRTAALAGELAGDLKDREGRLLAADKDLRHLMQEVEDREKRLLLANEDLQRLMNQVEDREKQLVTADRDLRRVIGVILERDEQLVAADRDLGRLTSEVKQREEQLVAADRDLRRLTSEVAQREEQLVAADRDLRRLTSEAVQREEQLVGADRELRRLMSELEEHEKRLVLVDRDLRQLMSEVEDRDRRLVAANDEHAQLVVALDKLNQAHREKQAETVDKLTKDIAQRDDQLIALGERLNEIEGSAIWRATTFLRKLRFGT